MTPVGDWVEGPTALKVGDTTYPYFDVYTKQRYGALRSRDLKTWENVSDQLTMPRGIRHGTALPVSSAIMQQLLDRDKS